MLRLGIKWTHTPTGLNKTRKQLNKKLKTLSLEKNNWWKREDTELEGYLRMIFLSI